MADVFVGYGDDASGTAVSLLAAAATLDMSVDDVRSTEGGFMVAEEIATEAGVASVSLDREV